MTSEVGDGDDGGIDDLKTGSVAVWQFLWQQD